MKTNVGLNLQRDSRIGSVSDCEVKYIAWGDGDPVMDGTDTTLANEVGRKAVTSLVSGGIGIASIVLYITEAEANGTITEIGFFAGASASATPGSGVLTDIFEWTHTKNSGHSLQLVLTDTHSRS